MANERIEPYILDFPNGQQVEDILKKADHDYSREEIDAKLSGKADADALAAETRARSDRDDTLYQQINQVHTLVINEYVDNRTFETTLAGGIKIYLITKADYDALNPPDASTLYIITDNGSVSLALAGTPVAQNSGGDARYVIEGEISPQINGTIQE